MWNEFWTGMKVYFWLMMLVFMPSSCIYATTTFFYKDESHFVLFTLLIITMFVATAVDKRLKKRFGVKNERDN